jgi:hypothetical protein
VRKSELILPAIIRYKLVAFPSQLKLLSGKRFRSLIMSNPIVVIGYFATLIFGFPGAFGLAGALAFGAAGAFGLAVRAGAFGLVGVVSAIGAGVSTFAGSTAFGASTLYGAGASTVLAVKPNKRLIKSIISIS